MCGSLTFLPPSNLAVFDGWVSDISFNIACKELKIAQLAEVNQLTQLLNSVRIYDHGFDELSRMLMRKNVNNKVSKDSPTEKYLDGFVIRLDCFTPALNIHCVRNPFFSCSCLENCKLSGRRLLTSKKRIFGNDRSWSKHKRISRGNWN